MSYALSAFLAGHLGDRWNPNKLLAYGIIGTAICYSVCGILGILDIEDLNFFLGVFALNGIC